MKIFIYLLLILFLIGCKEVDILLEAKNDNSEIVLKYIEKGNNLNLIDSDGNTLLLWAIKNENNKITKKLIAQKANVNVFNNLGESPISIAIQNQNKELIKMLVSSEAKLSLKNDEGKYPLYFAMDTLDSDIIKLIYKNYKVDKYLVLKKILTYDNRIIQNRLLRDFNFRQEDLNFETKEHTYHFVGAKSGFYYSKNQIGEIEVIFDYELSPGILILSSYKSTLWKIKVSNNAIIKKVIVYGRYESDVIGVDKDIVINNSKGDVRYLGISHVSSKKKYKMLIERLSLIYGNIKIKSIQTGKTVKSVVVDGIKNTTFHRPIKKEIMGNINKKVIFELEDGKGSISEDGLTVSGSMILANRGYRKGKWYFEAKANNIKNTSKKPFEESNVGISTTSSRGFNQMQGGNYGYAYTANRGYFGDFMNSIINFDKLKNSDIIGIAVDLDNSKIFFSLNGKWINGIPTDNIRGYNIESNQLYYPAVSTSWSFMEFDKNISWIINLGKKSFKYKKPSGFKAYD